ncbi:lipocalin family protein [Aquimarina muelleri]|uniref:lipocalin family protein n=1 Tax=Aquimarina muelleri TaxID=279356 RepID=UPI003F6836A1
MKKNRLLITSLAFGLLLSCNKDDDNTSESKKYEDLIVGQWSFSGQAISGVNTEYSDPCHKDFEVLSFKNDKTYRQTEFENINGTGCEETTPTDGVWKISGDKITLNNEQTADIITLNENVLSLKYTEDNKTIVDNLKRKQ